MDESDQVTQVIGHSRRENAPPKPHQVQAPAVNGTADPAPSDIVTTIVLKPGAKITIEYPK